MVVMAHRFAGSVIALPDAGTEWLALGQSDEGKGCFQPAVMLFGGWLPGSAQVSAAASTERGTRRGDRIRLAPYSRAAIQVAVAVGVSIALGDLVSGRRLWGGDRGVHHVHGGQQLRRAGAEGPLSDRRHRRGDRDRVAARHRGRAPRLLVDRRDSGVPLLGLLPDARQLHLHGGGDHRHGLAALPQLGEFSNSLLGVRLAETAIGSTVSIIVVMLILPLRTRRVIRALADHATSRLLDEGRNGDSTLRADARAVDATHQALVATAQPLRRNIFGSLDEKTGQAMRLAEASRNYSRNLVNAVEAVGHLDVLACSFTGPRESDDTRSSSLFDRTERLLEERSETIDEGQLAIRDLKLIDGAMAKMAEVIGLRVTDYDTVGPPGAP
jgi:hypothetical protein